MIGTVTFAADFDGPRRPYVLTLQEDGTWSLDPPLSAATAKVFHRCFDEILSDYAGPADGPYGPRQLREFAALFKPPGHVHLEPKRPMPPGTVY